jgi:hypothetical protein
MTIYVQALTINTIFKIIVSEKKKNLLKLIRFYLKNFLNGSVQMMKQLILNLVGGKK